MNYRLVLPSSQFIIYLIFYKFDRLILLSVFSFLLSLQAVPAFVGWFTVTVPKLQLPPLDVGRPMKMAFKCRLSYKITSGGEANVVVITHEPSRSFGQVVCRDCLGSQVSTETNHAYHA